MPAPLGASPEEWSWFARELGLAGHLLPAVPDSRAPIAAGSELKPGMLGAVPSRYLPDGSVAGLVDWPDRIITAADVRLWSFGHVYNLCVRGAGACAFDVDVDDPMDSIEAAGRICQAAGMPLPMRTRPGSGRMLLPFRLPPGAVLRKSALPFRGGQIELLGTRQQWVAAGTNRKSGARYVWPGGLPQSIPELTLEEVQAVWTALGGELLEAPRSRAQGAAGDPGAAVLSDPVAQHLIATGRALETGEGRIAVMCPWKAQHTVEGGLWEAAWHVAGSGGYRDGHFSCFHAGCQRRTDADFLQAIGYVDVLLLDDIPVLPAVTPMPNDESTFDLSTLLPASAPAPSKDARVGSGFVRTDRTDVGNTNLLAKLADGDLKRSWEMDLWLYWDGARWLRDDPGERARTLAVAVAEHYRTEGLRLTEQAQVLPKGDPRRGELEEAAMEALAWSAACRGHVKLGAMLEGAKADARFLIAARELDIDPWLLGASNCVVDLRTGLACPASRDAMVTHSTSCAFNPAAAAPRWERFIDEITGLPGDGPDSYVKRPELAAYLHRMLGLLCTGVISDQKLFIAHGVGSNGKNMLLDTVARVLGTYAQVIPSKILMSAQGTYDNPHQPMPYVRNLQGARMALASESKEGQRLDTGLIKSLTGDSWITARRLNENPVTFPRTFKPVLLTNHCPALEQVDPAVRGRIHNIPFSRQWLRPHEVGSALHLPKADETLEFVFLAESEGILAWLVRGAAAYHQHGLGACREVVTETLAYFEKQDPIGRFLALCERCAAPEGRTAQEFLTALTTWAEEEDVPMKLNAAQVGIALRKMGVSFHRSPLRRTYGVILPTQY
jgi:P4 family phage/plasmid primase-like protien